MKYPFLLYLMLGLLLSLSCDVLAIETAPRISDREIIESLAQLKSGLASLEKRFEDQTKNINRRFDDQARNFNQRFVGIDQRFDQMYSLMLGGFAVLFAGIFGLIGFVVWDRRTALLPLEQRMERIELTLDSDLSRIKSEDSRFTRLMHAVGELAKNDVKAAELVKAFSNS